MFGKRVLITAVLSSVAMVAQTPPPAPSPGQSLQLDTVVSEALANHPAIAAAAHMKAAKEYDVPLAKALPDPTLSVGWAGSAVPFKTMAADPSSYRGVTVMQPLPWPGKRAASAAVAQKDVAIAGAEQESIARRVVADAKAAYYEYFFFQKALDITQTNKTRLEQYADVSNARYRVGKANQQDVLRAQVEISILRQRMVTLEQQRDTAASRLNALMGRSPNLPLPPAAEPERIELPALSALLPLVAGSPEIAREDKSIELGKAEERLARTEFRPEIGVGYMYQQRTGMPDMYGATVSVSIPIFFGKRRDEAVAKAREETLAAQQSRTSKLNDTQYELQQAYLAAEAAERMASLYKEAVLPQTSLALESSESSYQVGSVDFLTMLTNFTTLNSYQIDYYRQLADYETAVARIEAITGTIPDVSAQGGQ